MGPSLPLLTNAVLAEAITSREERERLGLPTREDRPFAMVVELNLRFAQGLSECRRTFRERYREVLGDRAAPVRIDVTYELCTLSVKQARRLVARDAVGDEAQRTIYRIWPDFPLTAFIDRSVSTIKGDAAQRSYSATGRSITWAIVDSGIDARHPHFARYGNLEGPVADLHRDFTVPPVEGEEQDRDGLVGGALRDEYGHGTLVAGIMAGGLPPTDDELWKVRKLRLAKTEAPAVGERVERLRERAPEDDLAERLSGVAPACKLVSLKVMDGSGRGHASNITRALRYIREEVNGSGKLLQVQGVNLSVGYEFDAKWFACGQSPLCVEVDKLVKTGVVVVVAAGNTGYGRLSSNERQTSTGLTLTINDPGNAELAITVGATHRDMPHTYGVSYFSSKGPTGDGRLKPDLVAPGERITSCAAGGHLEDPFFAELDPDTVAPYVDSSGTSLAAPHVSGAIAAFLSIRREFIGQPERVKRIFCESATSLGRAESFQGRGMVDLMRAIQSV